MTTLEILYAARERIRQGWCQGASARDSADRSVPPRGGEARAWDAVSAIGWDGTVTPSSRVGKAFHALYLALQEEASLASWNDAPGRTQAEVLELYDRAIAAEEKRDE